MSNRGSSLSLSVTIKASGKKGPGKKALLPPTLSALKKTAQKILNLKDPVRAFYTEDGRQITRIEDVDPEKPIIASTDLNDDELVSASQQTQRQQIPKPGSPQVRISQDFNATGSSNLNFPGSRPPSNLNASGAFRPPSNLNATGGFRPPSNLNATGGFRPPSNLQGRVGSRPPSSLMIVVNDESGSNLQKTRRRVATDEFGNDDPDQFELEDNDAKRFARTGISYKAIEKLLGFLPAELTLAGEGIDAIVSQLSPVVARFASNAQRLQSEQESYIYKLIAKRLKEIPQHSPLVDDYAVQLVNDATFGTSCGATTHFRAVVVGPQKGGKSVFLQILANCTLLRMVASGQYKRTLFFNFDLKEIAEDARNPLVFYNKFVKIVFEQVANQRLDFLPFKDSLVKYFQKLPTLDKLTVLPQKFTVVDEFRQATTILGEVAQSLFECVKEERSLNSFFTNVVLLPRYAALSFGFSNVHFVVDHVDASDIDISPTAPFDANPVTVILIEHIKFMLSNDSFVISASDSDKLVEALDLITDDGVDLRDGTDLIPITDVDKDHSNAFEYSLTVEGLTQPAKLRHIDCGGCSGFLAKWDDIIEHTRLLTEEEQKDRKSRAAKECRLSLLGKIRELAPLVLVTIDPDDHTASPLKGTIKDFVINVKDIEEENPNAKY